MTLLGGYWGSGPPPTMARMLHRKSISTTATPPPRSKSRRKISRKGSQLRMRKPREVPTAKQAWSWLKEGWRRDGGGVAGGEEGV